MPHDRHTALPDVMQETTESLPAPRTRKLSLLTPNFSAVAIPLYALDASLGLSEACFAASLLRYLGILAGLPSGRNSVCHQYACRLFA
eukprot:3967422-Pleurochrysis_carterae.AAC.1